jgi:hypothetical protein
MCVSGWRVFSGTIGLVKAPVSWEPVLPRRTSTATKRRVMNLARFVTRLWSPIRACHMRPMSGIPCPKLRL